MVRRVADLHEDIPITMLYGSRSWIDSSTGYQVKFLREESYVDVQVCGQLLKPTSRPQALVNQAPNEKERKAQAKF